MATVAYRNNNPGNLITGDRTIYQGQIGSDSRGFAIFSNADYGIRAADLNLQSYGKQGYNTPAAIATHWSATDQAAYTQNLANALGVSPNTPVDLTNPNVRNTVLTAIFHQEDSSYNNSNPLNAAWDAINMAAKSGNPVDWPGMAAGVLNGNVTSVFTNAYNDVASAASGAAGGVSDALHFNLGDWLTQQANGVAKNYVVPIALGAGAILLVMVSSWGLVSGQNLSQSVKSAGKTASKALFI